MTKIAVLALGGNAITRSGQTGTHAEQAVNARRMAEAVRRVREAGWRVVVVHGNGPQVGNLAVQQEEAVARVPEQPLFVLGAMTEGQLGSLLALALREAQSEAGVVSVITHVVVDAADPAFERPTKPIGPFLPEAQARELAAERGWVVGEDAGRGFRRMVASPPPRRIVELDQIRALLERGELVIAAGGGGVPVVEERGTGVLRGVDAVIDKDSAAQRLATELGAQALLLVTDVPRVLLDFGTDRQRDIAEMTADEAAAHAGDGQFPEGSMGPKVRAAVEFVRSGGTTAVITDAERAATSLDPLGAAEDPSGTRIVARRTVEQIQGAPT
jgi:carbamate kinase